MYGTLCPTSFMYSGAYACVNDIVIAKAVDITERRASEVQLRESEAVLRLATSAGGVGTWTFDVATEALKIDSMAARIASVPAKKIRTMADLLARVHPADRSFFDETEPLQTTGITCRIMQGDDVEIGRAHV